MEAIAHQGVATLDARSLTGSTYVGSMLHTKYISRVPLWFQRRRHFKFYHYKSIGSIDPGGMTRLDPVA